MLVLVLAPMPAPAPSFVTACSWLTSCRVPENGVRDNCVWSLVGVISPKYCCYRVYCCYLYCYWRCCSRLDAAHRDSSRTFLIRQKKGQWLFLSASPLFKYIYRAFTSFLLTVLIHHLIQFISFFLFFLLHLIKRKWILALLFKWSNDSCGKKRSGCNDIFLLYYNSLIVVVIVFLFFYSQNTAKSYCHKYR